MTNGTMLTVVGGSTAGGGNWAQAPGNLARWGTTRGAMLRVPEAGRADLALRPLPQPRAGVVPPKHALAGRSPP